jgi:hypothetical protein
MSIKNVKLQYPSKASRKKILYCSKIRQKVERREILKADTASDKTDQDSQAQRQTHKTTRFLKNSELPQKRKPNITNSQSTSRPHSDVCPTFG